MTRHIATKAVVLARTNDGQVTYSYSGQQLPDDVAPSEIERLLADGFIRSTEN